MKRTIVIIIAIAAMILKSTAINLYGKRILYIGDSITDGGWGCSGGSMAPSDQRNHWDKNHIYGHSYMFICAAQLQATYPDSDIICLNRGISGDDINRLKARWQEDAIATKPDVISLLEGTNDVLYYLGGDTTKPFDINEWEKHYRTLLDMSRNANPQIKIVLGTPFVAKAGNIGAAPDWHTRDSLINLMADRIRYIAKEYDAILVDYNRMFAPLFADSNKATYWCWDGVHPTPAGHYRMAELWMEAVINK